MKRFSLLTIIACLLAGLARAATLSGTVTNSVTAAPVVGQMVYVTDSAYTFSDSAVTNSSGFYTITLPSMTARRLLLTTADCGTVQTAWTYFNGSTSITGNLAICVSLSTLHGTVSLGGAANNGLATVYLIRKQYDPVLMDTTLTAIDSMVTASTGGTFSKTYSAIPSGTLLLKAALQSTHPKYALYLPTYNYYELNWSRAASLSSYMFNSSYSTNISLIAGTNPGGPGFIGGSVLLGANKNAATGDPLSQRVLLLTNSAGQAVAYTYSDASGQFQFPNLAYDTYKIFGDAWGRTNPALTVTISATNKRISNIVFEENNTTFKGSIGSLSAGTPTALNGISVYPNPVTDHIRLNGLSAIIGNKTIVLSDITGAVIFRQVIEPGATPSISTAALPAGIYMLQLQTAAGDASFKIVK